MGSVNARDVPEEQQMWTEIWNWRKLFYIQESNDLWWNKFVNDGIKISEKYKTKLCQDIVLAVIDDIKQKGGE